MSPPLLSLRAQRSNLNGSTAHLSFRPPLSFPRKRESIFLSLRAQRSNLNCHMFPCSPLSPPPPMSPTRKRGSRANPTNNISVQILTKGNKMSILTTNLKHLYQNHGLWLWHLLTLCQMPMIFLFLREGSQRYLGYLLISYCFGFMVGHVQREILSKPFSFCLPGHSHIPQKFILWIGLVVNGLLGFVFLRYPGMQFPYVILVILAGSVVGMAFYLLFAGLTLSSLERNGFLSTIVVATVFAGHYLKWDLIIQEMIVTSPLIVISSGLLLCWLAWKWPYRQSLSRKYCGKITPGLFSGWDREKMSKLKQARLAEKEKEKPNLIRISSGMEGFFVSRIGHAETGSLHQYIWGALYQTFGAIIAQERQNIQRLLILILPILCLLCYIPPIGAGKNIMFLIPGVMFVYMSLPVYSSLSVSGGRRQRFWSAMTLAVTSGIFVTVAVASLAMVTHPLETIMPQLTISGYECTFNAIDLNLCFVPLLMIPITLTIGLIFHKKPMLSFLFVILLFQISFVVMGMVKNSMIMDHKKIGPAHIIIMLILSWTIFIAVLRYISMRCRLVTQNK